MKIILKRRGTQSSALPSLTPGEPMIYRDQLVVGSVGSASGGIAGTAGTAVVPRGILHTPSAVAAQTAQTGDSLQIDLTDYACASVSDGMMFVFKVPQAIGDAGAAVRLNSSTLYPITWSDGSLVKSVSANSYITAVYNSSGTATVTINGESFTSLAGTFQALSATDNNPLTVYWQDVQNKPNFQTVPMQVTFTDQSTATYNMCHIPAQQ